MSLDTTVETSGLSNIHSLNFLLGAILGGMTELFTVATLDNANVNYISSIVKTGEQFLAVLGPTVSLTRPLRCLGKPVRNGVSLAHVALQVHVGEDVDQRAFVCNQPQVDATTDEGLLELLVGHSTTGSFHILLKSFLDVVDIFLFDSCLELVPCFFWADILDVFAVDFASVFAVLPHVA